ncbi:hypothetical protein EJ04DRAFT_565880 [Polyplosphaeria fusca]|uniref:Uncharacterized protein n=1 Tax=Polyplosphaeria fusca TaxID=682080 RepID=A0A9P4V0U1_9PLEO|nr:hypothetical protein EJ04DRAFT_565880 [Polyplosphaeria fusca]
MTGFRKPWQRKPHASSLPEVPASPPEAQTPLSSDLLRSSLQSSVSSVRISSPEIWEIPVADKETSSLNSKGRKSVLSSRSKSFLKPKVLLDKLRTKSHDDLQSSFSTDYVARSNARRQDLDTRSLISPAYSVVSISSRPTSAMGVEHVQRGSDADMKAFLDGLSRPQGPRRAASVNAGPTSRNSFVKTTRANLARRDDIPTYISSSPPVFRSESAFAPVQGTGAVDGSKRHVELSNLRNAVNASPQPLPFLPPEHFTSPLQEVIPPDFMSKTTVSADHPNTQSGPRDAPSRPLNVSTAAALIFGILATTAFSVAFSASKAQYDAIPLAHLFFALNSGIILCIVFRMREEWYGALVRLPEDAAFAAARRTGSITRAVREGFREGYDA